MLQLALSRLVEIIGEAANRVPKDLRDRHATIPWREIVSARSRLIHGYDSVDLDILWEIVSSDLPTLAPQIEHALRDERT